ncbi:3446_t:CDS:2 [Paraglomus occultum]|uniref:3446_t:CDS:1 n=1 Tax=Paraglomus occultum TaxID=144539 RepID=A0A9N9GSI9_9GLOM|nr:3446_t:CDS:2 [Paraglomus occultum]
MNTKDEILFGKVKPPKSKNLSLLKKDLVKLANFQAGFLDELIKKYGNGIGLVSFGIWVCEAFYNIKVIFKYILVYCFQYKRDQIPLTHYFYDPKDRVSNVSETITHSNIPDFTSRSTYGRNLAASPEPVNIAIVGTQPSSLEKM